MKKTAIFLLIALYLQSCFSLRPVAVESELRRQHVGNSSPSDVRVVFGPPSEQLLNLSGEEYIYYKEGYDVNRKYGQRTTQFSFDGNSIVRNVTSDATIERSRFDFGKTVALVLGSLLGYVGLMTFAISQNSNQ